MRIHFGFLLLASIALAACASSDTASDEPGPNGYIPANPAPPIYVPHSNPNHIGPEPMDDGDTAR